MLIIFINKINNKYNAYNSKDKELLEGKLRPHVIQTIMAEVNHNFI